MCRLQPRQAAPPTRRSRVPISMMEVCGMMPAARRCMGRARHPSRRTCCPMVVPRFIDASPLHSRTWARCAEFYWFSSSACPSVVAACRFLFGRLLCQGRTVLSFLSASTCCVVCACAVSSPSVWQVCATMPTNSCCCCCCTTCTSLNELEEPVLVDCGWNLNGHQRTQG